MSVFRLDSITFVVSSEINHIMINAMKNFNYVNLYFKLFLSKSILILWKKILFLFFLNIPLKLIV